jgi:hypothetical protein
MDEDGYEMVPRGSEGEAGEAPSKAMARCVMSSPPTLARSSPSTASAPELELTEIETEEQRRIGETLMRLSMLRQAAVGEIDRATEDENLSFQVARKRRKSSI